MNFYDLPRPIGRELYEEAAELYAERVAGRSAAVYVIGNITFPGLSDLDLLVLTSSSRLDNAQYFSPVYRLGQRFDSVFLHGPLVVPVNHLHTLRYSTHTRRRLVRGCDLLQDIEFVTSDAERWCKLLESYCTYADFAFGIESQPSVRARRLIAKTSSLRFSLMEIDALCGTSHAAQYAQTIDELRAGFFESDPQKTLETFRQLFHDSFRTLTSTLQQHATRVTAPVDAFARRFFGGAERRRLPQIPESYVRVRSASIDDYNEELRRLKIPFGHIFFWEAHGCRAQLFRQGPVSNGTYRLKYRLERLLHSSGGRRLRSR